MSQVSERSAIALMERILTVLHEGRYTTTYKYAVLLALLDLSIEQTTATGAPPSSFTTRQVATRVLELYWPQVLPYKRGPLSQGRGRRGQRAVILEEAHALRRLASRALRQSLPSLSLVRRGLRQEYDRVLDEVEWTLIRYPLLLLQRIPGSTEEFLFSPCWTEKVTRATVTSYQRGRPSGFDNRLLLLPGVARNLVRLNGVLRPLVQQQWAAEVASINGLPEQRLQEFLFGAERVDLQPVRNPLRELQGGRCFYCGEGVVTAAEVDHFVPWSRYPDNGIDNLVVAHRRCNAAKRDFLAAGSHVASWMSRLNERNRRLEELSGEFRWPRDRERTLAVARGIYLRLPESSPLWLQARTFEEADPAKLRRLLV